ncbi:hypothetical protein J437_LFUL015946 [Ladona fulva]|uniref:Protein LLP homolog n=1 Tax=Ladona fulva TaxID=123851 RepID=A0A8K0KJB8_LADFU|nr:hypothetical protein J437_LFUL015946 [Ladona fulva]
MAKSIRSKWKKKMRAVKRVRYGKKELEKLKLIVGEGNNTDTEMKSISDIATVTDAATIKEKSKEDNSVEKMETGDRRFNKRTLRDQHGTYPVWMSQKQIRKRSKSCKRKSKKKKKETKTKRISYRYMECDDSSTGGHRKCLLDPGPNESKLLICTFPW